jgi:uncharacterized membrane protein
MSPTAVLIVAVVCAFAGWAIGNRKGHPWAGLILGAVLGVLGILIMAFIPTSDARKIGRERERQRIAAAAAAQLGTEGSSSNG